ncbi:MAG: NAD(P)/FAD-dependent oxidoreductase [bacterium]
MKTAIIGTGISGLTCAYLLHNYAGDRHDIRVYERAESIGGHTATVSVEHQGQQFDIDTGFIVYNDWTYPNFIRLMAELGIESQSTSMGFSVSCRRTGFEYSGANLDSLFAQRRNLFRLSHWRMIRDILRFNRDALRDLDTGALDDGIRLGDYLARKGYGDAFVHRFLVPMGSAIWSSTLQDMLEFPALFFVRFFKNHGLLSINDRPQWRVLKGGSRSYLNPLTESFADRIETGINITGIQRTEGFVELHFQDNPPEKFDQVVFACHSNQALHLLRDADDIERQILSAIPYRDNEVVLHTDESILPRMRKTWSSWNYHLGQDAERPAALSYNMNILQGINSDATFVVTLNASDLIDPSKIVQTFSYAHPVFNMAGVNAQRQWTSINGVRRTWFCGAYWQNGFHEDGCASGVRVARALGANW